MLMIDSWSSWADDRGSAFIMPWVSFVRDELVTTPFPRQASDYTDVSRLSAAASESSTDDKQGDHSSHSGLWDPRPLPHVAESRPPASYIRVVSRMPDVQR